MGDFFFPNDRTILHLYFVDGYILEWICQNSLELYSKENEFYYI